MSRPTEAACPVRAIRERLRRHGLRPTRQRVMLGWLLFGQGHRHVCAEALHAEARAARIPTSLATIYNTLHGFAAVGLLRPVAGDGRAWFDTNTREHAHFLDETTGELVDLDGPLDLGALPEPPEGYEIASREVTVRLRPVRR